jgi:carbamoyltransferase
MEHLYFGTGYSNEEIENVLRRNKLSYRPYDVSYVARKLAQNKIVGWFQGRMEGGPRALGGRSILMSPLKAENKDIINSFVKFREGFRPFCPSVTEEAADKYFDGGGEFMITACNVKTQDIPAVTHVDGTARPQIVKQSANPKFHALIDAFGKESGHPVLLNTSMNIMGEPIVRTPEEAIRCFYGVGMDLLVLGDFVLEKMGGEPK